MVPNCLKIEDKRSISASSSETQIAKTVAIILGFTSPSGKGSSLRTWNLEIIKIKSWYTHLYINQT